MSMFNDAPLNSNRKELIPFLSEKKMELKKLNSKSVIVTESDYVDWINSKIEDISIYEALKKKAI